MVGGGGGEGAKRPQDQVFYSTSRKVGTSLQNFLTVSFNIFATLVLNFKFMPSDSPKLFNLNQDNPSKKMGLKKVSNPYKIEIMIISLIETLELPNIDHMTTSTL